MEADAKKRLWLSVAVPPAAWAAQGLFGWFVSSHACPGTSQPWSFGAARWAVIVSAVVALVVSAAVSSVMDAQWIDEVPGTSAAVVYGAMLPLKALLVAAAGATVALPLRLPHRA
jgi:hypothetical protein